MKERDFTLAKLSVRGMLAGTFVLVVAGVLSMFGEVVPAAVPYLKGACIVGFTIIAAFALAVAQSAAACAAFLPRGERGLAYTIAFITGGVSVLGVILADAVLGNHPASMPSLWVMVPAAFALAFVKPAMANVVAACEVQEGVRIQERDIVLQAKDERIAELERLLRDIKRDIASLPAPTLRNKDGMDFALPAPRPSQSPPRRTSQTPPAIIRKGEFSLPLTEEELQLAVDSIVKREGAKVVSIASVAREARVLLDRPVPNKRVETHPKRREIFERVKTAA